MRWRGGGVSMAGMAGEPAASQSGGQSECEEDEERAARRTAPSAGEFRSCSPASLDRACRGFHSRGLEAILIDLH